MTFEDYPFQIAPLSKDDGGGFLVTFPDLPGCMADGDTIDLALKEAEDAFDAWRCVQLEDGNPMPEVKAYTGKFMVRMP